MKRFSPQHAQRMDAFLDMLECQIYPECQSKLHSDITQQAITHLAELEPLNKRSKVLDIGCGQGPALELFEQMGFTAVGITLGVEDIDECRSRGYTVARMDQSFLEFADNTFDIVWARHVIEHSIFPLFTLHEYYRVMRHDGILYLEVPAPDTDCHHERNINHYSMLSQSSWRSLIERTGYAIIETVSYRFSVVAGNDEYFGFYCKKARNFESEPK